MADKRVETTGIILLNLGGPDSLHAVRPFLYNLFSDRDIIRLGPSFLQKPLAFLISLIRSGKTRDMYRQIGGKSPILEITRAQANDLEEALNQGAVEQKRRRAEVKTSGLPGSQAFFKVYIGMRYWHPFIKDTVNELIRDRVSKIMVLSLYPHYSVATTGSAVSEFKRAIEQFTVHGSRFTVKYIEQWYDFEGYIDPLADTIAEGLNKFISHTPPIDILFSAHGLPESFIKKGDPYLDHIKTTIDRVNRRLESEPYNLSGLKWHLSFQSRTGPVKWLEPSTEETIKKLAASGCKKLLVVPISFVSDHIETLYEIDILYRNMAENIGIELKRCESLNTQPKFINCLKDLVLLNNRF